MVGFISIRPCGVRAEDEAAGAIADAAHAPVHRRARAAEVDDEAVGARRETAVAVDRRAGRVRPRHLVAAHADRAVKGAEGFEHAAIEAQVAGAGLSARLGHDVDGRRERVHRSPARPSAIARGGLAGAVRHR